MLPLLAIAVLIAIVDMPWLFFAQPYYSQMVRGIQCGKEGNFYLLPAFLVYLALAYLVTLPKNAKEAFLLGLSVYAVYDFTNLATLKGYDLRFAVADTLWGGFLFTFVWLILDRLQ